MEKTASQQELEQSTVGKGLMRAMRVHRYGGPQELRCEDIPVPALGPTDILVKVNAASVNPIDYKLASGALRPVLNNKAAPLPWIPGCDFSGVVEQVGENVLSFRRGDEVYGNAPSGGAYAQFLAVPAAHLAPKPQRIKFIEAASVPVAGLTAWQALFDHGHLQEGQAVLIHGGAGGVGSFAVQLAHWMKAKVLATASGDHVDYLMELGADAAIDYKTTPFETVVKEVDMVLDLIGGETQEKSFKVIKEGGILVSTVSVPSPQEGERYKVNALMMTMKPSVDQLRQIGALLDEGLIKAHVSRVYPLTLAQEAWGDILARHTESKIVLRVS
ncbi:MAG: NADP-dependent oxidoreductase [Candidatus Omnitrophica bacterium]|nr:NADP-dependent oxidoreductase [Candidatus Omnitrophota bacterium]MDE2222254.1 NADP-dependent oxidoreductase [Candidatus Omnitrophota bacterium]